MEAFVIGNGFTLDDLLAWGAETGNIEGADTIGMFAELPVGVCKRLLRAKTGLLQGLEAAKAQREGGAR